MLFDHRLGRFASADAPVPVTFATAIDVTHRRDLNALVTQKPTDIVEALIARPDDAQRNSLVGRRASLRRPHRPRRTAQSDRSKPKKATPIDQVACGRRCPKENMSEGKPPGSGNGNGNPAESDTKVACRNHSPEGVESGGGVFSSVSQNVRQRPRFRGSSSPFGESPPANQHDQTVFLF